MAAAYSAVVIILSLSSPFISASDGVIAQNTQFNDAEAPNNCSNSDNVLQCEIQGMKLMVARLGNQNFSLIVIPLFFDSLIDILRFNCVVL